MPRFTFEIVTNQSDEAETVTVDLESLEDVRREVVLTVNGMMASVDETLPTHLAVRARDDRRRLIAECVTTLKLFPTP